MPSCNINVMHVMMQNKLCGVQTRLKDACWSRLNWDMARKKGFRAMTTIGESTGCGTGCLSFPLQKLA